MTAEHDMTKEYFSAEDATFKAGIVNFAWSKISDGFFLLNATCPRCNGHISREFKKVVGFAPDPEWILLRCNCETGHTYKNGSPSGDEGCGARAQVVAPKADNEPVTLYRR